MTPQIQITLNCNLSCTYCFESHDRTKRMDDATLRNVIDKCVAYFKKKDPLSKELTFFWHGGEPLLCGIDFFKKILEFESRYPEFTFKNNVQTNGVAMTERMADFLVGNEFNIGFSMDGPEDIQNRHRVFRPESTGSFEAVVKGIERFKKRANVPYVAIIAVVSKYTVEKGAKLFYQFFKDLGTCLQFQPYDITWNDLLDDDISKKKREFMPSMNEYARFVIDLFDLWFYDDPEKILMRDLKTEIKMLLAPMGGRRSIVDKKRCSSDRTVIDPDGNVFSCDMYVNNERTALGNINSDSLEQIMDKKYALWEEIKTHFRKGKSGFKCLSCKYGNTCIGGCLTCMKYNYLVLKGYSFENPRQIEETNLLFEEHFPKCGDSYYCEAFKIYRNHIESRVKRELMRT